MLTHSTIVLVIFCYLCQSEIDQYLFSQNWRPALTNYNLFLHLKPIRSTLEQNSVSSPHQISQATKPLDTSDKETVTFQHATLFKSRLEK